MSSYWVLMLSTFTMATLIGFFHVLLITIEHERLTIGNTWLSVLKTHFAVMFSGSLILPFMFNENSFERTSFMWILIFVTFVVYGLFLLLLQNSKKVHDYTVGELIISLYYMIFAKEKYKIQQHMRTDKSVIQEYQQIQDIMNYEVKNMNDYDYNKFVAEVFYGYYWCEDGYDSRYKWVFKQDCDPKKFYDITKYKLKRANKSPITVKNSEESEIIAKKYKSSFAVIQSIIGKELNQENIYKTISVIQEYNSKLQEGVQEIKELRSKITQKEQERIQELLDNELEWFKHER